jgi:hypothetical protein
LNDRSRVTNWRTWRRARRRQNNGGGR